jgi:hypothetical protein
MFFAPFDTPVYALGRLEQGFFFRFTRQFQEFGPDTGTYLFLAGRRPANQTQYELLLEDRRLEEQRLGFPLAEEQVFLQSVEMVSARESRPENAARPESSDPLYGVFVAAEAGRYAEAEQLLRKIRVRRQPREGRALRSGASLESLGDGCRETKPELALWFYDHALELLYSWGTEATSGGDGIARMREIRPTQLKRDGVHAQLGGS